MTLTHEVPDDSQDGAEDTERSQDCHKDIPITSGMHSATATLDNCRST